MHSNFHRDKHGRQVFDAAALALSSQIDCNKTQHATVGTKPHE